MDKCLRNETEINKLKVAYKGVETRLDWIKESNERIESYITEYLKEKTEKIEKNFAQHSREINRRLKIVSFQWFVVLLVAVGGLFGWKYYDVYKDISKLETTIFKTILTLKSHGVDVIKEMGK